MKTNKHSKIKRKSGSKRRVAANPSRKVLSARSTPKAAKLRRKAKDLSKLNVLIADDLEIDRWLLKDAFHSTASCFKVVGEVEDGEQVIAYLAGRGQYADRERFPFPDVLLMDLMMPRKNGFEVLEWLESNRFRN